MDNRASVRTIGLVTGTVVLLIVLFLVAGISTGFLPWRDSYAQGPEVTPIVDSLEPAPTADPEATPTPTPTPEPEDIAPGLLPDDSVILDEELPTYTIIVTFSRGGTAIPYGSSNVVEGGAITVQAIPNEGYAVDEMIIDGERYKNADIYVFEDVSDDHNVHISFKRVMFDPNEPYEEEGLPPIAE